MSQSGEFHIDPVSQFAVHPLVHFNVGGVDLSYTNSALYMTIAVLVISALLFLAGQRKLIPSRMQSFGEIAYNSVLRIVRDNGGEEAVAYLPLVFSVFAIVLTGNLLGMIPGSFTYTSHIIVTLTLAVTIFTFITLLGFVKHGSHFLHRFIPPGVPKVMVPMIFALELFSYLVRPITLAVRLFANMLAGHMMLKVFAYFVVGLMTSGSVIYMSLASLPFALTVALIALEFLVACLQALIFTILTCVYLRDALVIEH